MRTCSCGGNNSLRSAIGAVRCECGGTLTPAQVTARIISRLEEIEEDQFRMIGALQRLGADRCDQCGEWDVDCWNLLDSCRCKRCLEGNPEGPYMENEDLDEGECKQMQQSIVGYLTSRGLRVGPSKELQAIKVRMAQ